MNYPQVDQAVSLQSAYEGFLSECQARRLSENTIGDYSRTIRRFIVHTGDMPMNEIKPLQITMFLRSRKDVQAKTIRNQHIGLAAFWTWALKNEIVERHVVRMVDKPRPQKVVIEPFTESDVNALLAAVQKNAKRDRAIIYLLLDTGIRAGEFVKLDHKDIDIDRRKIKVHGKGNVERVIPFSEKTATVLLSYLKDISGLPFALTRESLWDLISDLGSRAGIENCYPHRFRHTFAITYLRNSGDVFTLQIILGHSTLEMVKRYLAISQADLEAAHRRASPVSGWDLQVHTEITRKDSHTDKAFDMVLRKQATLQGFILKKDPSFKNRRADHQGGYMIVSAQSGGIVKGENFELTAKQVAELLSGPDLKTIKPYFVAPKSNLNQIYRRTRPVSGDGHVIKKQITRKPDQSAKAFDLILRREAERQGVVLRKDLKRNRSDDHQGGYMILGAQNNVVIGEKFDLNLDQVAKFLSE